MKESLIVSYRGLTEDEQLFMQLLENSYFNNVEFNSTFMINFIKEHANVIGVDRGIDLYKFFTSHRFCIERETYKKPVDLNVFLIDVYGLDPVYNVSYRNDNNQYRSMNKTLTDRSIESSCHWGLIYPLKPESYYFEIIKRDEDTSILYIKYQYIIGSRAIAVIKNNSFIKEN